ncbi:LrgB family protein [Stutzerimonas tarimensis]|uniref:LrgB family protein n=1 Tax=Stutzerimonas tarimensis TaxID=1507735 RepID=A0ABV7T6Z4_9GAMM
MSLDWQAALQSIPEHPLFALGITMAAFQLAMAAYQRTRWIFLQPVLGSMLLVIGVLLVSGVSYAQYREGAWLLSVLLGPATVALAVPLYLNMKRIRRLFGPIMLTLLIVGPVTTALGVALAWAFGASELMLATLAPKSVTSPIAMLVAEQIGGVAALAAVFVLVTGVLGGMFGPALMNWMGVEHPAARGITLGLTAHAVGTAQALQESDECGAFAAVAMSLMGVMTAVLLPLAVSLTG